MEPGRAPGWICPPPPPTCALGTLLGLSKPCFCAETQGLSKDDKQVKERMEEALSQGNLLLLIKGVARGREACAVGGCGGRGAESSPGMRVL